MALTEPFDILDDWPGWTPEFTPLWRQEQSRQVNGRTVVKDMGSPLWRMSAVSRVLSANLLDHWRARLDALENGLKTFRGYKLSRCFPIAYPRGTWPGGGSFTGHSATLHAIQDNKAIQVAGLPACFELRIGDMVRIGAHNLHEVMEPALAAGTGITGGFEVRPHLWPGTTTGAAVSVRRPFCLMALVPGSISAAADPATGRGPISFEAIEARA